MKSDSPNHHITHTIHGRTIYLPTWTVYSYGTCRYTYTVRPMDGMGHTQSSLIRFHGASASGAMTCLDCVRSSCGTPSFGEDIWSMHWCIHESLKLFRKSCPKRFISSSNHSIFGYVGFQGCISVLFDGKNTYSFLLAKIYVRSSFLFETAATCTLFINWDAGCKGPVAPPQSRLDPGNHLKKQAVR